MSEPRLVFRAPDAKDLDLIIQIDQDSGGGASRRGFFAKRLAAAEQHPEAFISFVAADGNKLIGFAFCHITEGEYGDAETAAVLDAIAVNPGVRGRGIGRLIMAELVARVQARGGRDLRTQARWDQRGLLDFFASSGFSLQSSLVLECGAGHEPDPGSARDDGVETLSRDRTLLRSLSAADLNGVVRIDSKITGRNRHNYFQRKFDEVLNESGIRVSLVAENDGQVVGFIMARVDYGEFGQTDTVAVLDTLGVAPDFQKHDIGRALMSQLFVNLASLRVEQIRTLVQWQNFALNRFLERCGFRPSQRLALCRQLS